MKITAEILNVGEFARHTGGRWHGELLEFFACPSCGLILLGIPDCHIALHDADDLKIHVSYNVPHKTVCPKCKTIWYDFGKKDVIWQIREVTDDELYKSNWKWILKARV